MQMESLQDLFIEELRDAYSAEQQLLKALPKMAKGASSEELKKGFEEHLEQTKEHVNRLDQIFKKLEVKSKGMKCKAMEGLIDEAKDMLDEDGEDEVLDAGIIAAAQKVEHYEIASYGCLRSWAERIGDTEAAELLEQTLNEEKETDEKLNKLAESMVNPQAAHEEGEMEEGGEEGEMEEESEEVGAGRGGRGKGSRKNR